MPHRVVLRLFAGANIVHSDRQITLGFIWRYFRQVKFNGLNSILHHLKSATRLVSVTPETHICLGM